MHPDTRVGNATSDVARGRSDTGGGVRRDALSRHRGRIAIGLVLAVVAAVSIGRFLTASVDDATLQTATVPATADSTIAKLESAVTERPDDGRSWQKLGAAYVQKLVQSGDPAFAGLAQRAFDTADSAFDGDVATTVSRAQLALTLHQFGRARDLAAQADASSPANNDALLVLVDANIELGQYEDATTNLQELLDRKPGFGAYSRVSYLRELYGDVDGALAALREAQNAAVGASEFDVATISAIRGDLLYNHGRIDEAAAAYDEALARSPQQLVAVAGRARVAVANGNIDQALAGLRPVAEVTPTPGLMTLLGDIALLAGRVEEAESSFEVVRATSALNEASGAAVDLESALFEADHGADPAAALAMAEVAYAARPSIHGADVLAWARFRAGDYVGATSAIDEALRLDTRDARLLYHAAAIHSAGGENDRASRDLTQAFAINPYFAIGDRDEVSALAGRLEVAIPQSWEPR